MGSMRLAGERLIDDTTRLLMGPEVLQRDDKLKIWDSHDEWLKALYQIPNGIWSFCMR